ncbi:MAG TPA: hydroxyacid dehydrogenase [Burkholderiaceae bacterium]|nr:hydroxyacid dehydrogenase [Burkholderiaceae bacterium]
MHQVVRFNVWIDPAFGERLAQEPSIALTALPVGTPDAAAWQALADARVFHLTPTKDELPRELFVDAAFLARCPRLLCVSSGGAGYDTIDVPACTAAGVVVVNQSGGNAVSVAEMTLGLVLDVSRRITESDRRLRSERGFSREALTGREISGRTIGLVGIGEVGRRVAALARAFGMPVLATDPYVDPAEIARRGAQPVGLDELLERSDFVSLHCPRDASTLNMIDEAAFARMKPGAVFISTARGGIHDEDALARALAGGHLAGAGLDVWQQEPPPLDSSLLKLPNVVATFHTAGVTGEARRTIAAMSAEQIVTVLAGRRPPRLINPEVWPMYRRRFTELTGRPCAG